MSTQKRILPPRIKQVEETEVGRLLAHDPVEQRRYAKIVGEIRALVKDDVEACLRSERLTYEDLHTMVY